LWLGAAGALPFLAGAVLAHIRDAAHAGWAVAAALAYGAVILSFLGGIQWGLAMSVVAPATRLWHRLGASVLPALLGWLALLLPQGAGVLVLAGGFAVMLIGDLMLTRDGAAPLWYPRLRSPLSAVVIACLAALALA
jgi:hypothetical protein